MIRAFLARQKVLTPLRCLRVSSWADRLELLAMNGKSARLPRLITDHLLTASGRIGSRLYMLMALGLLSLWHGHQALISAHLLPALNGVISLSLIYLGLCLFNQRLHDIGRSGWWAGPALLATVLALHGLAQIGLSSFTGLALWAAALGPGLIPSVPGHNRYGPPSRPGLDRASAPAPEPRQGLPDQRSSGRTI